MNLQQSLDNVKQQYDVLSVFDLNQWFSQPDNSAEQWLSDQLKTLRKHSYEHNQRLIFTLTSGDHYETKSAKVGVALKNLQFYLNQVDISNFFIIILTNEPDIDQIIDALQQISHDPVPVNVYEVDEPRIAKKLILKTQQSYYQYNSSDLVKMDMDELSDREKFLLTESKTFCIYPWIHLHAYPSGKAYPCCHAEMGVGQVGDCHKNTLAEIWQDTPMQQLRKDMLNETQHSACRRCYEQEANGFFSGRKSANKHHGHRIKKLETTPFEMTYWDIRFSNLCNLSCRSCGHVFSSSWYQDQTKLAGPEWAKTHKVLNYAGRTKTDLVDQLLEHIDHVEQIYFAGGEPLMMEEHYLILDELERHGRFDVRLIYNTNFTKTRLKTRSVFDYWRKFQSVAIGASLDDFGSRAEYIRKGTDWSEVEKNRREMMKICPNVDFYISPTLSILNAWNLPDFHRHMIEQGLIKSQDLNVNILQDPPYYRIDIAPAEYKQRLATKYLDHINWLRDKDPLQRATVGFESAVKFMMATDNTHLIDTFWRKTHELDSIRKENILDVIPELAALK
jgi:radical SAM protein with 4Fe4S-binding SPASM domain